MGHPCRFSHRQLPWSIRDAFFPIYLGFGCISVRSRKIRGSRSSSAPGSLSNLLSLWGHNIKTPACLQGIVFLLNVKRSCAPCGVSRRPCDARDACVAAAPAGGLRLSTRTKNTSLVRLQDLLRHTHNPYQGTRCVLSWPLSPAHAHTDITCAPGPAAYAATDHYTYGLLCLQVLGRDDQPTGAACSRSCMSSACTSSSRWMEVICVYRSAKARLDLLPSGLNLTEMPQITPAKGNAHTSPFRV